MTQYLSDAELDLVTGGGYVHSTNINVDKNFALVSQQAMNLNIGSVTSQQSASNFANVYQVA